MFGLKGSKKSKKTQLIKKTGEKNKNKTTGEVFAMAHRRCAHNFTV